MGERSEIESTLASVVQRLKLSEERVRVLTDRLAAMQEEHDALLGEAALAKQESVDFQQYVDRLQEELAVAIRIEEAQASFQQVVDARDAALEQASLAVEQVAAALEHVDVVRESVAEAHAQLQSVYPDANPIPAEPLDFRERWTAVAPLVEQALGRRLDSELIEAAARSGNHLVVKALPEHLRILAIQRRREFLQRGGDKTGGRNRKSDHPE